MSVARTTIPQEFYDITSEQMLVQPEPQYLYAVLLFGAVAGAELKVGDVSGGIGLDGRKVAGSGAAVPSLDSMQLSLANAPQSKALMVNLELYGKGKIGQTVRMNRPVFAGGGYTLANRQVNARQAISTVPVDISSEQVSLTLQLNAGPFASGGSVVQPFAIDAQDAERSVHDLAALVALHMQRDRFKFIDTVLGSLFASGTYTVYASDPTNALSTANSAFLAQGDRPLDIETLYRAEEKLAANNIPRFANGRYICVLSTQQVRQLRSDPEFNRAAQFFREANPLFQRYVASVGNLDIFECTTNTTGTANGSITYQIGTAFGPGMVGYAPGEPCMVRPSSDDNYGLLPKVIWTAFEAFSVLDNRFGVQILSD